MLDSSERPLIIGETDDVHVEAVVSAVRDRGGDPEVLDLAALERSDYELWATNLPPGRASPRRGWLRRLAPQGWREGTLVGSHESVVRSAWATLFVGYLHTLDATWVSSPLALAHAENKLVQLRAAARLGLKVPRTVISSRAAPAFSLGDIIVKPLGEATFTEDGKTQVVYATKVDPASLTDEELGAAPFLVQEFIAAAYHARIVTVGDQAFPAVLDASNVSVDWRLDDAAHDSFTNVDGLACTSSAVQLARHLELGYSSQDWIITSEGDAYFLDLNPSGQWLFLPTKVATAVTDAIAEYLTGQGETDDWPA